MQEMRSSMERIEDVMEYPDDPIFAAENEITESLWFHIVWEQFVDIPIPLQIQKLCSQLECSVNPVIFSDDFTHAVPCHCFVRNKSVRTSCHISRKTEHLANCLGIMEVRCIFQVPIGLTDDVRLHSSCIIVLATLDLDDQFIDIHWSGITELIPALL